MMKMQTTDRGVTGDRNSKKVRFAVSALVACAATTFPLIGSALPVIPGAVGYGIDTAAGRGGTIYRVTNLNADGAGSLKACTSASGPRVCVFEVSGTIRLTTDLHIRNPNITIAGQTAPSPGISLRGAALNINASDVLVQHIRIRVGDDPEGPEYGNRDALKIESEAPVKNVVVDHVSLAWALDETLTAWENWDNITVRNSIIAEALQIKPNGKTSGYGIYLGQSGGGRATVTGNLLAHTSGRNPLVRSFDAVIVNNVMYNTYSSTVELQSLDVPMKISVVGNTMISGVDTGSWNKPVMLNDGEWPMISSSKVYLSDNATPSPVSDAWSITNSGYPASLKSSTAPIWPSGLTVLPTANNVAMNSVLKNAGARPVDRDSVDTRVVQSVRDRTGKIINCVSADGSERCKKNAGGWPTMAQNRRTLVLPSNPSEVTANGYTKLEVYLQDMAASVEGRVSTNPRPPALKVE